MSRPDETSDPLLEDWLESIGLDGIELACEGAEHPLSIQGHDDGPAEFAVTVGCPSCPHHRIALLCRGRVEWILGIECFMTCPECGYIGVWQEFWRDVVAL